MHDFNNILFFADDARGERKALRYAIDFAERHDARITVMDVVQKVSTDHPRTATAIGMIQRTIIRERGAQLDKLIADVATPRDFSNISSLVVPGVDFAEVIRMVVRQNFDLVLKSADPMWSVSATLFGSTDLRLIRKCPCPVWIVKPDRKTKLRRIVAAVDPRPDDRGSHDLGTSILDIASDIAAQYGADLNVLHAWEPALDERLRKLVSRQEIQLIEDGARTANEQALAELLAEHPQLPIREHFVEGEADQAIEDFVESNNIDLLVMGTLSRGGVPGLLLGNTAEKVLNSVDCSVLTVKPKGFVTPAI